MKITDLINENLVILDLKATDKISAIKEMVQILPNSILKDREGLLTDILNRENQTTTGIGNGIAIPHAKSDNINITKIVFAKSSKGIEYEALDDKPVNLLFLLAVEKESNNIHIKLLSALSKLLLNKDFKKELLNATNKKDIINIIKKYENLNIINKKEENTNNISYQSKDNHIKSEPKEVNIAAVTACPTGIAHTYMAQEALEKAAKKLNVNIKVETNGAVGVENQLTAEDINKATAIILAINRNVETTRFKGKKVITVSAQDAINNSEEIIKDVINAKGTLYYSKNFINEKKQTTFTDNSKMLNNIYKHLMGGVSYMLPFVISGGILIALAFLIDKLAGVSSGNDLGSTTYLANLFMTIGKQAFSLFIPVLGAFIAYSIANRAALTAGFVGGALAVTGGSGFLGAILAGFIAGYITIIIKKLFINFPKSLEGIKIILIYPILTVLLTGIFMIIFLNVPVKFINDFLNNWLISLVGINAVLLGAILGGMMAIDMGGPFNKAAYVFAIASLSQGASPSMASVMLGGMVPPLAIALATSIFKNKFTNEQREAGKTNYIMGLSFITEGVIPFVATDPFRMIPICVTGSAIAGGLSMWFNISLPAPHGGIIVMFLSNNFILYFLSLIIGSVVSALLMGVFKPKLVNN